MKEILIKSRKYGSITATVDDEDFDKLSTSSWSKSICGNYTYAGSHRDGKYVRMHRFLMGNPQGKHVDHIDGNTMNNQKGNLRVCTHFQNIQNSKKCKRNKSGYKGVWFVPGQNKYASQIMSHRKRITVGSFETAIEAAIAYNLAAKKLHGDYAKLNQI